MQTQMNKIFRWVTATLFIVGSFTAHAEEKKAGEVVAHFYQSLEQIMREAQDLGFDGRYKVMAPAVTQAFDVETMARVATGAHWGKISPEQKSQVVEAFSRLTAATYASSFKGYKGEKFEVLSTEEKQRGRLLVKTRLIKSDGEPIAFDYLMQASEGQWKIVDIFLLGSISQLAVRKSEYSAALAEKGVDGLVAIIDKTIQNMGLSV